MPAVATEDRRGGFETHFTDLTKPAKRKPRTANEEADARAKAIIARFEAARRRRVVPVSKAENPFGTAALRYAQGVDSGEFTASVLMRRQARRWLRGIDTELIHYEPGLVDEAAQFAMRRFVVTGNQNRHANNRPFEFTPFQSWCTAMHLASFEGTSDVPVYEDFILQMMKNSGKGPWACVMLSLFLVHPRYVVENGRIQLLGATLAQIKDGIMAQLQTMIRSGDFPELTLTAAGNNQAGEVINRELGIKCRADSPQNPLRGPTVVYAIVDEYSDIDNPKSIEHTESSFKSASPQRILYLTNAGRNLTSHAYQSYVAARDMLLSKSMDAIPTMCPVICQFDVKDKNKIKFLDRKQWERANPNIGFTCSHHWVERNMRVAIEQPHKAPEKMRLFCGLWLEDSVGWIDNELWESHGESDSVRWEDLKRCKRLFVGVDLARVNDLLAWYILADTGRKTEAGRPIYAGFLRAFTSMGNYRSLEEKSKANGTLNYEVLERSGHVSVQQRQALDFALIGPKLLEDIEHADEVYLARDPYKWEHFMADNKENAPELANKNWTDHGHNWRPRGGGEKGVLYMDDSLNAAERLLMSGQIEALPNPLMQTSFGHATIERHDQTEQRKITKTPKMRIQVYDPAVAFAYAAGIERAWQLGIVGDGPSKPSPWDGMTPAQIAGMSKVRSGGNASEYMAMLNKLRSK